MILTSQYLYEMFRIWGDKIDKSLEAYLLATYEEEPFPNEWSEQDLYEQVRKLLSLYNQGKLDTFVPSPEERQKQRYEALKESYLELLIEINEQRRIISRAVELLKKTNYSKISDDF